MKILLTTITLLALKIISFRWGISFTKGHHFLDRGFLICCVLFFLRCMIFKKTENEDINHFNHGDFLSEPFSLAFFYFFRPDFKTALYFHLSFGLFHYIQYIFVFIIPKTFELICEGIKAIFSKLKRKLKPIPKTHIQTPVQEIILKPETSPAKNKVTLEEIPNTVIEAPQKRLSIYEI